MLGEHRTHCLQWEKRAPHPTTQRGGDFSPPFGPRPSGLVRDFQCALQTWTVPSPSGRLTLTISLLE
jgi:hypothetical protein